MEDAGFLHRHQKHPMNERHVVCIIPDIQVCTVNGRQLTAFACVYQVYLYFT